MMRTLSMIAQARKAAIPRLIVPTLYDKRTRASRETLEILRENYPNDLWELIIPVDTQFRDASKCGIPLSELSRHARGVIAFEALLDYVITMRIEGDHHPKMDIARVNAL